MHDDFVRAMVAFADPATRADGAQRLAAFVGADVLLVLVADPAVKALVPAPGFPRTLPGGDRWRDFLRSARASPRHLGVVGYPLATDSAPACSWTIGAMTLVFIGDECHPARVETVLTLAPLIASLIAAEHDAVAARGELRAAQDHARQAETLAMALDAARAELERSMAQMGRQAHALEVARVRTEEAARAKDEFLAMLGHELRNPLAPIVTALQLLRLKNLHSREQDVIERQVANLMRLVDDLLDISRITRGRVALQKGVFEVAQVATQAVEIASPEFERKRQRLRIAIAPTGLLVDVDSPRMTQVLANLLTNAAKYSDPESCIELTAEPIDDVIRIMVRDEGIGLQPEMLAQVFDPFFQAPQALDRSQGGLGLGLAIVGSLVELHNGRVWAESRGSGRGSAFFVELPRASAATIPTDVPASPSEIEPPLALNPGQRVLVVDDNDDARVILSEALIALGHEVRAAADGPSALSVAQEFGPQVALLDIGLPVMDGYELARALREKSGGSLLRLIAVTGYGQESDRHRTRDAGFDAHLVKPVMLEDLARALTEDSVKASF